MRFLSCQNEPAGRVFSHLRKIHFVLSACPEPVLLKSKFSSVEWRRRCVNVCFTPAHDVEHVLRVHPPDCGHRSIVPVAAGGTDRDASGDLEVPDLGEVGHNPALLVRPVEERASDPGADLFVAALDQALSRQLLERVEVLRVRGGKRLADLAAVRVVSPVTRVIIKTVCVSASQI